MEPKPLRANQEHGKWGEETAAAYLASKGYAIIVQNWRMQHYEIDIVAQQGKYIVFVEVKTRRNENSQPIDAVNKRKRAHMVASADVYMNTYNVPLEYRFDIIAVTGTETDYSIEHIPDAFVPGLKRHGYSFRF